MVKIKEDEYFLQDGNIEIEGWLRHLHDKHPYLDLTLIRTACMLSQLAGHDKLTETGNSCLQQGVATAEILVDLELDAEAVAAAIVYPSVMHAGLTLEDLDEQLGKKVSKLVRGVQQMHTIHHVSQSMLSSQRSQIDNIRKMLLAMVDDVRVVLIKLAERLCVLRHIGSLDEQIKKAIAQECMDVYAPLANRLGIGQLKWEMEDLAFRYLEPDIYKEIAKGLKSRRVERDHYVDKIVALLQAELDKEHVQGAKIYGRSKHIHSIYRKMQRKNVPLSEIYDATALRVLANKVEDCYQVLSITHSLWQPIPAEFDDYIAHPKENGYRSLHTAVIGPENRNFEVQIRTYEMHDQAELGVAAHWKYKEGAPKAKPSHERKIEWLREVFSWHKELAKTEDVPNALEKEFLEEHIYVFTPNGEIVDLPRGATPLDFAYNIHSQIGHRCRGAKVNGHIVQLTYTLKTGEQVEILTAKEAKPSRDWLNPHLGYVHSPRSKSKILHWFKQLDFEKNCAEGEVLLDRELRKLAIKQYSIEQLAKQFHYKKNDDFFAAIGRGDIRVSQVVSKLPVPEKTLEETLKPYADVVTKPMKAGEDIFIEGVGNLLTSMAKCCRPMPGDKIVGYITQGRGVTIHRQDCPNILAADEKHQNRLVQVDWGHRTTQRYPADILINAYDRHGLLQDITTLLTSEKTNIVTLTTITDSKEHMAHINLTLEISGLDSLSRLLDKIKQVPNVVEVRRA